MSGSLTETSFFDAERERLTREITAGFEDLLSSTNLLNRKLEEVLGMTKEYDSIATLWGRFYSLMSGPQFQAQPTEEEGESPVSN